MRALFGVSSSIAKNVNNASIETIQFAGRNHFEVVELFCEVPDVIPGYINEEKITKIKQLSHNYNIRIQLHAPFHSINLASFNEKVRKLSIKILYDTIKLAHSIDAKLVTFHLGLCFFPCQLYRERANEILIDSLNNLLEIAEEYDIILAMENRGGKLDIGKPEELLEVLRAVNANKYLRITFDVVQANVIGDPLEQYNLLKDYVINAHIRDAPKGRDMLLAVGEGEIDFHSLIRAFIQNNFFGPYIFEVSTKDRAIISRGVFEEILEEIISQKKI